MPHCLSLVAFLLCQCIYIGMYRHIRPIMTYLLAEFVTTTFWWPVTIKTCRYVYFPLFFLLKRTKTFFYIKYNSFSNKFILCFSLGVRSRQKFQLNEAPNFFFPGVASDWIRSRERKFFRLKMFNFILFWCGNLIFVLEIDFYGLELEKNL